jgi:hypothetical protein
MPPRGARHRARRRHRPGGDREGAARGCAGAGLEDPEPELCVALGGDFCGRKDKQGFTVYLSPERATSIALRWGETERYCDGQARTEAQT